MKFLQHFNTKGVPINNIVFFKTSVTLWSNACEYGIRGYSKNVLAWQYIISAAWNRNLTLNLLEFLASEMTIYTNIMQMGEGSHILAFTESSSALGWMHKASFDPVNIESHNAVSHWLGWTVVNDKTSLYSQHIKGTENIIADSLSKYFIGQIRH